MIEKTGQTKSLSKKNVIGRYISASLGLTRLDTTYKVSTAVASQQFKDAYRKITIY